MPRELTNEERVEYLQHNAWRKKYNEINNKVEYLTMSNQKLQAGVKRIFGIWDACFKTIGVLISVAFAVFITYLTRGLYYDDGARWTFSTVFFGGITYLIVLAAGVLLTWWLVNLFLVKQMNCFSNENENGV